MIGVTAICPLASSRLSSRRFAIRVAASLLLGCPPSLWAVSDLGMHIGRLEGDDWRVQGVRIGLHLLPEAEVALDLEAQQVELIALGETLRGVRFHCRRGTLSKSRFDCQEGDLRAAHPLLGASAFPVNGSWDWATGEFAIGAPELPLASGQIALQIAGGRGTDWSLAAQATGVDLQALALGLARHAAYAKDWQAQGNLGGSLDLEYAAGRGMTLRWNLELGNAGFSAPDGAFVGEGLQVRAKGRLQPPGAAWTGQVALDLERGAMLTPWVFLSAASAPLHAESTFAYDPGRDLLDIDKLHYVHHGIIEWRASARLGLAPGRAVVERLQLRTAPTDPNALYAEYMQPLLAETLFDALHWSGSVELHLEHAETSRAELVLRDLSVAALSSSPAGDGGPGRRPFELQGAAGRLVWTQGGEPEISELTWEAGKLLERVPVGPARLRLRLADDSAVLLEDTSIPLFDGQLLVDEFSLHGSEASGNRLVFQGIVTPISMAEVSAALDWPPLSGALSGVIPSVSYQQGVLQVDGNLLIRIFEGDVVVRNLRLDDLLGVWPVMKADVELKNLDLQTLTGTFSFGKITGRLEGRVDKLRLENWAPVAFDARFATPADDDSKHRISQKAVDNISDLGGAGVSGALSRTFLRSFEEFGYRRLGISCRLEKGVCEMDGIKPAAQGYYLVEGAGLPRIDILGFNRHTDWKVLVEQFDEITRAGPPVIE